MKLAKKDQIGHKETPFFKKPESNPIPGVLLRVLNLRGAVFAGRYCEPPFISGIWHNV